MNEKVVIVTGGTGALGRVIVEKLSLSGFKVYVPTLTMDEFTEVFDRSAGNETEVSIRKIFAFDCNALDEDSVEDFVGKVVAQEKGNLGYLVNTVGGIDGPANVGDLSSGSVEKMMALNFYSAFHFTKEVLKTMKQNNFGRIVSIGALAGMETSPGRLAYSVSKCAVINLMNTASEEYKDNGIRCNSIVPGIIDTPANREWGSEEDIRRWVSPVDVADVVVSLFSDGFNQVRGSIIKVLGAY